MNFLQSISIVFKRYAVFKGRASRSEFWWWLLFAILLVAVGAILEYFVIDNTYGIVTSVVSLILFLPHMAVSVRRCHDSGHTGWWILCPIANIIMMFLPSEQANNDYGVINGLAKDNKLTEKTMVGCIVFLLLLILLLFILFVTGLIAISDQQKSIKVFSVSKEKQVLFSPGNLQYNAKDSLWRFAQHQYDYIGFDNQHISPTYEGWIDLFAWGTGVDPTNYSFNDSDYLTRVDWGWNNIEGDTVNKWRTLTADEWAYLLYKRYNASQLIGIAQVNGINGMIILPDNWLCPMGVSFRSGFNTAFNEEYTALGGSITFKIPSDCAIIDLNNTKIENSFGTQYYEMYQSYTSEQWEILQKSGAIFLPAAGSRSGKGVYFMQIYGYYWTATSPIEDNAVMLAIFPDIAGLQVHTITDGRSVRLVKDVYQN